ncbi:MAG: o-succinylbenzoate--CoA ligase [Candidatus Omnitrophota bacterium]
MKYIQCPINKIALSAGKNKTAILMDSGPVTYSRLEQLIRQTTYQLTLSGINKKTKVGMYLPNGITFIVIYFALLRAGAVPVLLNMRFPLGVVEKVLINLNCLVLLTLQNNLKEFLSIKCLVCEDLIKQDSPLESDFGRYALNSTSNIMFTSGSEGTPKAVVHTIENHYYSALGSNRHIPLIKGDQWMLSLPAYHVAGLSVLWRVFMAGASLSVMDDRTDLVRNLKKYEPSHISLVSTQLIKCLKDSRCRKFLSTMKCILIGGSAANPVAFQTARELRLPIYVSYGLTEMSSQVATSKKILSMKEAGPVRILPYRRLRIDSNGNVLVKGKTLFKGYYVNGHIKKVVDKEGWFKTGDLGLLTKGSGLKIIGRRDNMFISGGENIYPEEIEREILQSGMIEQAVVVSKADPLYGCRPVAFVKMLQGKRFSRKKLIAHLKIHLEKYKIPDEFFYIPEPEPSAMKINRRNLESLLRENSSVLVKAI